MLAYVFPFGCIFATVVSLILPSWSQFIMHHLSNAPRDHLATIAHITLMCVCYSFVGSPTSANVVHSVGRAEVSVAFMTCASSVRPDYRTRLQRYYEELVLSKFFRNFFHFFCTFSFRPVTISLSAVYLSPSSTWRSTNKKLQSYKVTHLCSLDFSSLYIIFNI